MSTFFSVIFCVAAVLCLFRYVVPAVSQGKWIHAGLWSMVFCTIAYVAIVFASKM